jgi:DNA-directed RNA polymerase subunit RPC12/RpoP
MTEDRQAIYQCGICGTIYDHPNAARSCRASHKYEGGAHKCQKCGNRFNSSTALATHALRCRTDVFGDQ